MPRLAIVIPCPGGAELFEDTLVSVLQHRPSQTDVLLVHAQPYADPYQLDGEVQFLHVPGETNVCRLINEGAAATDAPIVHLLGCGNTVSDGWTLAALRHFQDASVAAVVPLVLDTADTARLVSAGVEWAWGGAGGVLGQGVERSLAARLAPRVLGPTWNAALYRREVWDSLGGFNEQLSPEAAAVDLALSLRELEYTVELETTCTLSGAAPNYNVEP